MAAEASRNFFGELFPVMHGVAQDFSTTVAYSVAHIITPVVGAVLTLSFIFYAVLIAVGAISNPLWETLKKMLLISVVVSVALTSGVYQAKYVPMIAGMGDSFAQKVLGRPGETVASVLDVAASSGIEKAGEAQSQMSFLGFSGTSFGLGLASLAITACTIVTVGIGGMLYLVADMGLWLVASVGPLFLVCVLLGWTRRMFEGFVSQIFNYWLAILLLSIVLMFFVTLYSKLMDSIRFDGTQNILGIVVWVGLFALVSIGLLLQVNRIASMIGGISLSYLQEASLIRRQMSLRRR